jgi:Flp pilus assembly protein TadD
LKQEPQSAEAANGLGLALAKRGELAKAQSHFEQAIAQRRDYAEAINNLAVLFSREGKMNDAVAAWNYGIQMCPAEAILYLNLGRAYVGLGQFDKARVIMQELLEHDANNQVARRALQELNGR